MSFLRPKFSPQSMGTADLVGRPLFRQTHWRGTLSHEGPGSCVVLSSCPSSGWFVDVSFQPRRPGIYCQCDLRQYHGIDSSGEGGPYRPCQGGPFLPLHRRSPAYAAKAQPLARVIVRCHPRSPCRLGLKWDCGIITPWNIAQASLMRSVTYMLIGSLGVPKM